MDATSATQLLASLTLAERARMVAMLCHDVTVVARDTYDEGTGVQTPARLRALNEIQHRMTGFLNAILEGDQNRSPVNAIAEIFFADREDKYLRRLLMFAFDRVYRAFREEQP